jgi:hypothetical protein
MSACCGGETKRSVFVAREEKALDLTQRKVLLLHTGDEETNVTVNGRSYRLGTGQNRAIEVPQEDVEDLLERGKFKIASDWYGKAGGVVEKSTPLVADKPEPESAVPVEAKKDKDAHK